MQAKRAIAPHLRLASVDGLPIKGKRPKRRFAASDLNSRIFGARSIAGSVAKTCEHVEDIVKALYLAIPNGDLVVIRALARDALHEIAGTSNRAQHVAIMLGEEEG